MSAPAVVKVTITENQTRITIPKYLSRSLQLIKSDGSPGKYSHVLIRQDRGESLLIRPVNTDIS